MRTAIIIAALVLCACNSVERMRADRLACLQDTEYADEIKEGRVVIGMTQAEALAAIPQMTVSYSGTWSDGTSTLFNSGRTYVRVDDGFVTAVSWHGR